jgi:23S rRNA (guanine745-N1)-methyltransferase
MLICPVRDCRRPLVLDETNQTKRLLCPRGHSFDIARSGYINLLQPQERRSKQPGDAPAAVEARQRLHDRGVTGPLLNAISAAITPTSEDVILDAGCGDGFYLGNLAPSAGFEAHGLDISIPAVRAAARRFPNSKGRFEWIVANADRLIPYSDASFSCVLSITGRMNAPEFRRVLRQDGRLLVALASPVDIIELRGREELDQGRDRVPRTIETFAREFKLIDQRQVTTIADLDAEAVHDVLVSIYRPMRSRPIEAMRVTFSLDLLLFRPT